MSFIKATIAFFLFTCLLPANSFAQGEMVHLKVQGNQREGFYVNVYKGTKLRITRSGEFSIELFNLDYSTQVSIADWKGQSWEGNDTVVTLTGTIYIKDLDANLDISVRYQVIDHNIIKKTIRLNQPSMPEMYYILRETAKPAGTILRYTTFEHDSFPGGFVHEMYPAAGWVTSDHEVVGFLTDAGYKNQYTRTTRRRFSGRGGGFVGMRKLPDPELYFIATKAEQKLNENYIRKTYGMMYNLDAGTSKELKLPDEFVIEGHTEVKKSDKIFSFQCHSGPRSGVTFISPMKGQHVYTISFECKGTTPVALKLFQVKNGVQTVELEDGLKYIDAYPTKKDQWTLFKGSILVPYINEDSISLFIGTQSGKESTLQIKNLTIEEDQPQVAPYNFLPLGKSIEKVSYAFIEPWKNHEDFMILAQSKLAEGKGFRGSLIEKMVYANFNMLTWITSVNNFDPFNVPNMNYMPDMYNRDCFFSAVSTYNKDLNLSLWNQWGKTQNSKGAIGTIITPYMGSVEVKDNEATIEWLMWAMLNKRRFGVNLPRDKIEKAVNFVLNEFDSTGDGICRSHFPLCQVDIIDFNPKTDRLAVNQGMLAVALRTIKELGFPISASHIERAEQQYRNFYDKKRKHLLFDKNYPDLISVTDLEPEFYSLWLFKRPILTDEMVINHLNQIPLLNKVPNSPHPELGTTAPILIHLTKDERGYSYLNKDYQPFGEFGDANYSNGQNAGFYYNGGSWLRGEYCAYVAGLKHGWTKAKPIMENRLWAEIYLNPKWPFSKEFIPTKWTSTDSWWPSTKGLCWNVFILMADEVAGLRRPDMDPDYKKGNNQ